MLSQKFRVVTIVLEPLGSEGVDHDGSEWCCNHDGKDCSSQHCVSIFYILGQVAFLSLGEGETTQGCLDCRLGNPSKSHKCAFLVVELFLAADNES